MRPRVSKAWLLLGWIGGLVGYVKLREHDREAAQRFLTQGVVVSAAAGAVIGVLVIVPVLWLPSTVSNAVEAARVQTAAPASSPAGAAYAEGGPASLRTSSNGCAILPEATAASALPLGFPPDAQGPPPRSGNPRLVFETAVGPLEMVLDRSAAPCNVQHVINLAGTGFYEGTTCHRLTLEPPLQILQCGDPIGNGAGGPGFTVRDEYPTDLRPDSSRPGSVVYPRGTVAMANNGLPSSAGSQFFLVFGDSSIPPTYSVIGTLTSESLLLVEEVARGGLAGGAGSAGSRPAVDVTIQDVAFAG